MPQQPNWFRKRRDELGLSLSDVVFAYAKRGVQITISAISGWENGRVPGIDQADLLADVYQTPVQDVLNAINEQARERRKLAASRA